MLKRTKKSISSFLVACLLSILILSLSAGSAFAAAPAPINPVPLTRQVEWQKLGLTAFCHFGMNTFTDREWGTGTESPSTFNPTALDANQWVSSLQNAGFKMLILTAKHHDGFCLWPSAYTTHDVASSPWKNGTGDVVREVADACHNAGMKFGVYLSPWDMHEPTYGSGGGGINNAYNTFYKNQLTELLSNYGEISEVWWDGAKGSGLPQDYDFVGWAQIVHNLQPNAVIFQGDSAAEIRWVGNEQGTATEPCWSMVDASGNPSSNGVKWLPAECDVSIRPGWFYHQSQDTSLKTADELVEIYKSSTGHNAQLLLNVPPDKRGLITDYDKNRLIEFRDALNIIIGTNLANGATATASSTRGTGYEASKVLDTDPATYWAAPDGTTTGTLELNFGVSKVFDMVMLQEPIQLGERITSYTIDTWNGSAWTTVATKQVIGNQTIVHFAPVTASKVRLNVLASRACPAIHTMKVFKGPNSSGTGNLALYKTATASNTHSAPYAASYAVDGDTNTRWATTDNCTSCTFEVDFGAPAIFNRTVINQQGFGQRIKNYKIQYLSGSNWVDAYSGNTPAEKQTDNFAKVTSNKVRLNILDINGSLGPTIWEFEVYNIPNPTENLALNKTTTASNYHSAGYEGAKATDGNGSTRWATADSTTSCWLEVDFGGQTTFTKTVIKQAYGQRIKNYQIQYYNGAGWSNAFSGVTPALNQTDTFPAVTSNKVRLNIIDINGSLGPTVWEFEVYNSPNLALNKTTTVSTYHSAGYEGTKATDGNPATRWATPDTTTNCWLEIDFGVATAFNKTIIKQAIGQRIKNYKIQYLNGSTWVDAYSGTTPALTQTDSFTRVTSNKVRLNIIDINGTLGPTVWEFEVYNE